VRRAAKSRATGWKLASYEVAGNVAAKLIRPERTMDAAVPSGRISFCDVNQTLRVWLISGCPVGTKAGATPKTATGTGALPSNVPAGRPMAVWGGRTGQWVFESQDYANNIEIKIRG
jgi:hypothetical protein